MASRRGNGPGDEETSQVSSQRIDKWLVFARVVKTRSIAQQLVETKKVRLNKEKIDNPARNIRAGDVLTISYSSRVHVLKVRGFAERRGSASDAQALYENLNAPAEVQDNGDTAAAPGEPTRTAFEGVFDEIGRQRKDPVQRDKDRRKARKERARRESW
ncbi:S4 domain-containing protein [Fulvimarina sp. MAC8]|uniref:RNA-binding S4 domain-containing protein n=1 Tax=Fulvimarina sp. MAC8 TaxID=3162874 RepID=UPI0032F072CB